MGSDEGRMGYSHSFVEKVYDKMKAEILPNWGKSKVWRGSNKKKKSKKPKK